MARALKTPIELEAQVVSLAHDGRGVARIDGKVTFIAGALPGERVRIGVTHRRRQVDEAKLLEVLEASPERVTPRCRHFGLCGGCALQHLDPAAQLRAKEQQLLENFERIGKVTPARVRPPVTGPAWAYRRRARLGVKYVHKKGRVLAGFRERDKPYLADLAHCEVLLEPLADLPTQLAALTETLSIREALPQVEVAAGDGATALVFRVMQPLTADDAAKLSAFGAANGFDIYLQPGGLDTIRPLEPGTARVLDYRVDDGAVVIEFGPVDFVQVNAAINEAMVGAALAALDAGPDDAVLDLFCGLGNFTLPLARRAGRVTGVEGDAGLVARARQNALRNGISNASFAVANLFEPKEFGPWAEAHHDLLLLDPPRAGAAELMVKLPRWRARRVVYISCHPGSLARDAGILVNELNYRLVEAGVMDMFPHTTHVESIAVFEADL